MDFVKLKSTITKKKVQVRGSNRRAEQAEERTDKPEERLKEITQSKRAKKE